MDALTKKEQSKNVLPEGVLTDNVLTDNVLTDNVAPKNTAHDYSPAEGILSRKACEVIDVIKKQGGQTILGPLSLTLRYGEILGIRGENGAGKSTLLKIMCGMVKADSGQIRMDANVSREIGYIPQEISLYMGLTGKQNLEFWAGIYGLHGKQKKIRVAWLLKQVGLTEKADTLVSRYSGGMCRRLNFAAALLKTPPLMLLDEPTVGADDQSVAVMLDLMKTLRTQNVAVVFVSHQGEELRKVCDRIITMEQGKVVEIEAKT